MATHLFTSALLFACRHGHVEIATLLLDRDSTAIDETYREAGSDFSEEVSRLLSERIGKR